jgi:hypothetical protein
LQTCAGSCERFVSHASVRRGEHGQQQMEPSRSPRGLQLVATGRKSPRRKDANHAKTVARLARERLRNVNADSRGLPVFEAGCALPAVATESEHEMPGLDADASGPGIFAELVSISSTRPAGVSDSAYFIKSIELRPTFDLFSRCTSRIALLRARLVGGSTDWAAGLPQSSTDRRPQLTYAGPS